MMLSEYSRMLSPQDIEKLQVVFDEVLRAHRLSSDCENAQFLAARLIELYQGGDRDAASLRSKMTTDLKRA